ncbi:hypothetical protein Agub_g8909 [Astrephomene gubernaculifera]|uniref:Guanylate cyclase n=1 Tax=Astrephomene gubernaculifera TaxID=47775 RepID=A0AAD3HNW8_9CHLO|nr:hypothetical protein Agub_g8909 [Astrephomene gubernaculifera]
MDVYRSGSSYNHDNTVSVRLHDSQTALPSDSSTLKSEVIRLQGLVASLQSELEAARRVIDSERNGEAHVGLPISATARLSGLTEPATPLMDERSVRLLTLTSSIALDSVNGVRRHDAAGPLNASAAHQPQEARPFNSDHANTRNRRPQNPDQLQKQEEQPSALQSTFAAAVTHATIAAAGSLPSHVNTTSSSAAALPVCTASPTAAGGAAAASINMDAVASVSTAAAPARAATAAAAAGAVSTVPAAAPVAEEAVVFVCSSSGFVEPSPQQLQDHERREPFQLKQEQQQEQQQKQEQQQEQEQEQQQQQQEQRQEQQQEHVQQEHEQQRQHPILPEAQPPLQTPSSQPSPPCQALQPEAAPAIDQSLLSLAAKSSAPAALLILSAAAASPSAAPATFPLLPTIRLSTPLGMEEERQPSREPHHLPSIDRYAIHADAATDAADAAAGIRNTCRTTDLDSGTPAVSARCADETVAAGKGQMPVAFGHCGSSSCSSSNPLFSPIWVNASARQQLHLGSAVQYDSVLTRMCDQDPALSVLLKEIARQLMAEGGCDLSGAGTGGAAQGGGEGGASVATLLRPVTHLVPGGNMGAPRTSAVQPHGHLAPGCQLTRRLDSTHVRPSHSPAETEQPNAPSAVYSSAPSACNSSFHPLDRDSGFGAVEVRQHGFTVIRLTPCRLRLPVAGAAARSECSSQWAHAGTGADDVYASCTATDAVTATTTAAAAATAAAVKEGVEAEAEVEAEVEVDVPGLLLEHLGCDKHASTPEEVRERLQRDCSILSGVSAVITLFDLHGRVLHQNAHSVNYMGYHRSTLPASCYSGGQEGGASAGDLRGSYTAVSTLERLFQLDSSQLPELWAAVLADQSWKGIVRMPPSLLEEELEGEREQEATGGATPADALAEAGEQAVEQAAGSAAAAPPPALHVCRGLCGSGEPYSSCDGSSLCGGETSDGTVDTAWELTLSGVVPFRPYGKGAAPTVASASAAVAPVVHSPMGRCRSHSLPAPGKSTAGVMTGSSKDTAQSAQVMAGDVPTAADAAATVTTAAGDRPLLGYPTCGGAEGESTTAALTANDNGNDGTPSREVETTLVNAVHTAVTPGEKVAAMGSGGGSGGGTRGSGRVSRGATADDVRHGEAKQRSHKGLDLKAITASAWSLVGSANRTCSSASRARRASQVSPASELGSMPPVAFSTAAAAAAASGAASSPFGAAAAAAAAAVSAPSVYHSPSTTTTTTNNNNGGGGGAAAATASQQQPGTLSAKLSKISAGTAISVANALGGRGRSTPLPRVVFFAAAATASGHRSSRQKQSHRTRRAAKSVAGIVPINSENSSGYEGGSSSQAATAISVRRQQEQQRQEEELLRLESACRASEAAVATFAALVGNRGGQAAAQEEEEEVGDVTRSVPLPKTSTVTVAEGAAGGSSDACKRGGVDGAVDRCAEGGRTGAQDLPGLGSGLTFTLDASKTAATATAAAAIDAVPSYNTSSTATVALDPVKCSSGIGVRQLALRRSNQTVMEGAIADDGGCEAAGQDSGGKEGSCSGCKAGGSSGKKRVSDGAHSEWGASAAAGEEEGSEDGDARWHEVTARPFRDPVTHQTCILLMQVDVTAKVETERRLAELVDAEHKILEQIFPRHVLEHMALDTARAAQRPTPFSFHMFGRDCSQLATKHEAVTILFADIKGFTDMCKEVEPEVVMSFLNELYNRLDSLLDVYGVYKVETIGDCYMVAGGLIRKDEEGFPSVHDPGAVDPLHAVRVMSFAKAMLREAGQLRMPLSGDPLKIRIGIHSGPVVSGVVGMRMPRFCLFGDTVNTASRMESTAEPGTIHVSGDAQTLLRKEYWEPTGGVEVKGKGLMHTFVWRGNDSETAPHLLPPGASISGAASGGSGSGGAGMPTPRRSCTAPREKFPSVSGLAAHHQGMPPHGLGAGGGGGVVGGAPRVSWQPRRSSTVPREEGKTALPPPSGASVLHGPAWRSPLSKKGSPHHLSRVNAIRAHELEVKALFGPDTGKSPQLPFSRTTSIQEAADEPELFTAASSGPLGY